MTRFKIWCTALVALLAMRADAFADLTDQVGDFSDPDRLVFGGDSPFSAEELRRAVAADAELQIVGRPSASLGQYLQFLPNRLAEGFRHAGFSNPLFRVVPDSGTGKVVVLLELGHRWKCGKILVQGAKTVSVDALTKSLLQDHIDAPFKTVATDGEISVSSDAPDGSDLSNSVTWKPGEFAHFDAAACESLTTEVRQQLARMGYLHPFLHVAPETNESTADLVINLIDEGPRVTLKKINFHGLDRNTAQQISDFLKITTGDPVNLDRMYEMQKVLWDSGRFLNDKILVQQLDDDRDHVNLDVTLKETTGIPPLGEPLSDVDQGLLRFRNWCLGAFKDTEDCAIDCDSLLPVKIHAAWNAKRGLAIHLTSPTDTGPWTRDLGDNSEIMLLISDSLSGIYLPRAGLKFEGHLDPSSLVGNLNFDSPADAEKGKDRRLGYGMNINFGDDKPSGGLEPHRWLEPATFLMKRDKENAMIQDGELVIDQTSDVKIRVDINTGRLIELRQQHDGGPTTLLVAPKAGALDAMTNSFAAACGGNAAIPDEPIASALAFSISAVCHSGLVADPTQRVRVTRAIRSVATDAWLKDAASNFAGMFPSAHGDDFFFMPPDSNFVTQTGPAAMAATAGLQVSSRFFAPHSWPATLLRCASLYAVGHGDVTGPEMDRLASDVHTGPVACLTIAEILRQSLPQASQRFAQLGLQRLDAKAFAFDCWTAVAGKAVTNDLLLKLAENLRHLPDDQLSDLCDQFPAARESLQAMVSQLKTANGPLDAVQVEAAVEKLWTPALADQFKSELTRLSE